MRATTTFGLALVGCATIAALVLARPESVPANLAPPPRSAASQAPAVKTESPELAADPEADPADEPPHGYALTRQDLDNGLLKVHGRAMACRSEGPPPVVLVHLMIAPSGQVTSVGLPPDVRGTRAGECIAHAMHGASFPSWKSPATVANVEWSYPLRFEGVE